MKKIFLFPEERIFNNEFPSPLGLRQPKGIEDTAGYNWVAKDLGTHFLVMINTENPDVLISIDQRLDVVSFGEKIKSFDIQNKVPSDLKIKVEIAKKEIEEGKINVE